MACGCGGIKLPNATVSGVNVPALKLRGYNLSTDYDPNTGRRKPTAVPREVQFKSGPEMLNGMNKMICTDPAGYAELIRYINQIKVYCQ